MTLRLMAFVLSLCATGEPIGRIRNNIQSVNGGSQTAYWCFVGLTLMRISPSLGFNMRENERIGSAAKSTITWSQSIRIFIEELNKQREREGKIKETGGSAARKGAAAVTGQNGQIMGQDWSSQTYQDELARRFDAEGQ